MPIYEYACMRCMRTWEVIGWHGMNVRCEKCGDRAKRVPSAAGGYHIKGDNSASQRPKGAGSFKGRNNGKGK